MEIPQNILRELEERKAEAMERERSEARMAAEVEAPQRMGFVPSFSSNSSRFSEPSPHRVGSAGGFFFELLAKCAVYLAILITPLFVAGYSDVINLPKQLLLTTLALAALAAWVGRTVADGQLTWRKSQLFLPLGLVAAAAVLSSVFSSSFWVSFLGDSGRFGFSGASILSYIMLFVVGAQTFEKRDLALALVLWLGSVFLASVYALLQFFGIFIWPQEIFKARTFNSIGSSFGLALFVLSAFPFAMSFLQNPNGRLGKIIAGAAALAGLVTAAFIGFKSGWLVLGASVLCLILINFKKIGHERSAASYQKNILLPMVAIILAAVFWFAGAPQVKDLNFSPEINPSYGASWEILVKTIKEKPIFGSGLETYPYVYAKFKSPALNQTNYWGINFNDAIAEAFTWATTTGIFGAAAWLFFVAAFILYALKSVSLGDQNGIKTGLFGSWAFILISKFFYSSSVPLELLFWLLPVFFALTTRTHSDSAEHSSVWSYHFQSGSTKTLVMFFALMVVLLSTLAGAYFSVKRWQAESRFSKVFTVANTAEKRDDAITAVSNAVLANPYESRYFRVLAQVLFAKMNDTFEVIQKRPENERAAKPEETIQLQNLTVRTISVVQRAVTLDPQNVGALIDAAESYRNLTSLVQGADDLAIQNYEKAVALEPINPFIKTQLAQTYLFKSGLLTGSGWQSKKEFTDKAKTVLQEALKANQYYANAKYFMGVVYDFEGQKDLALKEFKELAAANPDNQLVKQTLRNVENGLSALGYPPSSKPPLPAGASETKGVPASPSGGPAGAVEKPSDGTSKPAETKKK